MDYNEWPAKAASGRHMMGWLRFTAGTSQRSDSAKRAIAAMAGASSSESAMARAFSTRLQRARAEAGRVVDGARGAGARRDGATQMCAVDVAVPPLHRRRRGRNAADAEGVVDRIWPGRRQAASGGEEGSCAQRRVHGGWCDGCWLLGTRIVRSKWERGGGRLRLSEQSAPTS